MHLCHALGSVILASFAGLKTYADSHLLIRVTELEAHQSFPCHGYRWVSLASAGDLPSPDPAYSISPLGIDFRGAGGCDESGGDGEEFSDHFI